MSYVLSRHAASHRRAIAVLAATSALIAPALARAQSADAAASSEIVVTANKRAESIQKVPMSMTALGSAALDQHQVQSLDDYQKLLPSVSTQSFGPGQSEIYFRGVTTGIGPVHVVPTSSLYIDETPVTTPSGAPDLHMYDIARVEALAGPQGTLFGASALSGTMRIITNKPRIGQWEGGYDLELNQFGHGGGTGGQAEGYLNIPLNRQMALRLVGFYDKQGGYISNTYATRTYERPHTTSDGSVENAPYTVNNGGYAKKNFNDIDTLGGRAELLIDLDNTWTVEPELVYQHQIAHGTFLYDPHAGDLDVHDFTPDHRRDDWFLASLTVQGKLSDWDMTYAGSYFQRVTDTVQDYSYYSVAYDSYTNYNYLKDANGKDIDPTQTYHAHDFYTKQSQEIRVNSPAANRLRLTAGLFYQRQTVETVVDYEIQGLADAVDAFSPSIPGAPPNDPFYNNTRAVYHDYAAFGEVSFDIVPHVTAVAGIRGFVTDNSLKGFSGSDYTLIDLTSCPAQTVAACPSVNRGYHESGQTHRVSLRWQITPQKMVYATYSTGYRPGGVNRDIIFPGQSIQIPSFRSDTISNYEMGWKTAWLDDRLVVNASLFWEDWDRVQYPLPGEFASYYVVNAGTARSRGVEGNVTVKPIAGLTLYASGAYTDARLTSDFSTLAPAGTRMPLQPRFNINANARYDFTRGTWTHFVQASVFHQSSSTEYLTSAEEAAIGPVSGYATFDFSLGTRIGTTTISAYVQNAFDSRGILSKNSVCAPATCAPYIRLYPVKPQLFGIKFGQKF